MLGKEGASKKNIRPKNSVPRIGCVQNQFPDICPQIIKLRVCNICGDLSLTENFAPDRVAHPGARVQIMRSELPHPLDEVACGQGLRVNPSSRSFCRFLSGDAPKVTEPDLRFPAVFCENLRFSAKICSFLRFPAPSTYWNFQEKG